MDQQADIKAAISEFIDASMGNGEKAETEPCLEARMMEITDAYEKYVTGASRFRVGDWVTFQKNSFRNGAGKPHRIVEIREDAETDFAYSGKNGDQTFGARNDTRVMTYVHGSICCYWTEAWELEPYQAA